MAPFIDSHIHLWPSSASNGSAHAWMSPGHALAKPHGLDLYQESASSNAHRSPDGIIYIETDRSHGNSTAPDDQVLLEATYLGELCRSEPGKELIKGIVPWCPVASREAFTAYVASARQAMGAETWDARVKGFRYLFQAIHDRTEFESVVLAPGTADVMRELGRLGKVFDVGVDQRSGGVWQLEVVDALISVARGRRIQGEAMIGAESADSGCVFVLNHLCKPSFELGDDFEDWKDAIEKLARHARVYMKLSGAFSELQPPRQNVAANDVYQRIKPWVAFVFKHFGAHRVMFGSDWPVCNLGGPGEKETWSLWKEVVELALDDPELGLTAKDKDRVWGGTAVEAYGLEAQP